MMLSDAIKAVTRFDDLREESRTTIASTFSRSYIREQSLSACEQEDTEWRHRDESFLRQLRRQQRRSASAPASVLNSPPPALSVPPRLKFPPLPTLKVRRTKTSRCSRSTRRAARVPNTRTFASVATACSPSARASVVFRASRTTRRSASACARSLVARGGSPRAAI